MCISILAVSPFQIAESHAQPKFLMIIEYIMQSIFSLKKYETIKHVTIWVSLWKILLSETCQS